MPQKLYGEIELYVSGTALLRWWHSYLAAVAMQCCCGSNAVPPQRENFATEMGELCYSDECTKIFEKEM